VTLPLVTAYVLMDIPAPTVIKLVKSALGVLAASISVLMIVFTLANVTLLLGHVSVHLDSVERTAIQPVRQENGAVIALSSAKYNVLLIATRKTEIVTVENLVTLVKMVENANLANAAV